MKINVIAAVARNNAIGKDNKLIYWLPNDLKRFKSLTTGHTIIMGRNTFLSLPKGALPNRRNIVLSTTQSHFDGCDTYSSLDEAIANCKATESLDKGGNSNHPLESLDPCVTKRDIGGDIYIIGGASVYTQAIAIADRLCLTEIDDTPEDADTFFPDYSQWKEVWREDHEADERHKYNYSFVDYERK